MGNEYNLMGGNPPKPYPIEGNYQVDAMATSLGEGSVTPTRPSVSIGQAKYARREGVTSIYKDPTRNTADDQAASTKAEGSTIYEDCEEGEESEGDSGL